MTIRGPNFGQVFFKVYQLELWSSYYYERKRYKNFNFIVDVPDPILS